MNIERTDVFANVNIPKGFLANLWGFFLFVVCAIVGCVLNVYWTANNALVSARLQANDVELVVLEGSVQNELGDMKLGKSVGEFFSWELFQVETSQSVSPPLPQYMWKGDEGGYQPLYGVFGSLKEAEAWATDHGFEFDADSFNLVLSSEEGIRVTLPTAPFLEVHVFTKHYAIIDEGCPVYAKPIAQYVRLVEIYSRLRR